MSFVIDCLIRLYFVWRKQVIENMTQLEEAAVLMEGFAASAKEALAAVEEAARVKAEEEAKLKAERKAAVSRPATLTHGTVASSSMTTCNHNHA